MMDILADEAVEHKAPPNRAARRAAASADRRASWSINEWCAEAGIGRVKGTSKNSPFSGVVDLESG